jgi:Flp pilus assembly protein TadB
VSTPLLLSALALVAGGLLIAYPVVAGRRPAVAARLERAGAPVRSRARLGARLTVDGRLGREAEALGARYERSLRQAGDGKTVVRLLAEKALLAIAFPLVPLLPYAAATGRLPSAGFALALAVVGFFVPDLALRSAVKRRCEDIFLEQAVGARDERHEQPGSDGLFIGARTSPSTRERRHDASL